MFKTLSFEALCDRLTEQKTTLLLCHTSPDADTVGAALALASLLRVTGSRTYCACADPIPEHLEFFTDGRDALSVPEDFRPERVISVDVASPNQLGALFDVWQDKIDLMIDHHERGVIFADAYVDAEAAATGEIVYEIGKRFLKDEVLFRLPPDFYADCYTAVSSDTGGFRYSNTRPETMLRAADMMSHGIDIAAINHQLFSQKSFSQMQAEHIAFERLHLYADGKIAVLSVPYAEVAEHGFTSGDLGTVIDVARQVRGVVVAAAIRQPTEKNEFRVSLRASEDVDVAALASRFGGGGHKRAAGCTVCAADVTEAESILLRAMLDAGWQF